ncbi:MAG: hypothetical protein CML16_10350 [Pusillimonas sp.]|nr:hypothetical protein [Pusillimonas sp.]HCP79797.1 hypothetical protein [Pusillimonas sp.]
MRYASIKLCQPALRPGGRLGLGVTEEIETALVETVLGCAQAWSCVLTCGLVSFEPPKDMSHLSFFADNDESGTGQRSAAVLGKRGQRAFLRRRWLETGTTNCGFGRRGYDDVEAYV